MKFEFKHFVMLTGILGFVLIQITGRIGITTVRENGHYCEKPTFQYGYPIPFIEALGGDLIIDISRRSETALIEKMQIKAKDGDFEKWWNSSYVKKDNDIYKTLETPLSIQIFVPLKPWYMGSGRVDYPRYTGYFLWECRNYSRITHTFYYAIYYDYFTDRIVDFLSYHLSLAKTVSKTYDSTFNTWRIELENIPWRCALFNFIYLVVTILGLHLFFRVPSRIVNRIVFYSIFTISVIMVLISIHDILFYDYVRYDRTFWFYSLLYSINVELFIVAILGYMIAAVKGIKSAVRRMYHTSED